MAQLLRCLDHMQKMFGFTWRQNLQTVPGWMRCVSDKLKSDDTHVNIKW